MILSGERAATWNIKAAILHCRALSYSDDPVVFTIDPIIFLSRYVRGIHVSHADYRAKYPELSSLWPKNL